MTSGETVERIMPKMYTGKVVEPGPAMKNEVMKSSMDMAKANKAPEIMAGESNGNVILVRISRSFAPKSAAASKGAASI